MSSLVLAKPIGHLGQRLRPQNSNNILYNITFLSLKKKKAHFSHWSDMKTNLITKSLACRRKNYKRQKSLACRRKDYKRQKEETNKKKAKKRK